MSVFVRCFIFLLVFSSVSCGPQKVCSGLNPEIGKYNTSKKVRKGRRSLHSGPEKEAYRRRAKQMKKKKARAGKSVLLKGRFLNISIGGGRSRSGSIGGGGGGNVQQQKY